MALKIILMIIVIIAAFCSTFAYKNSEAVDDCIKAAVETIKKNHVLKESDTGEFKHIKVYGFLKFNVKQYCLENIGNVSTMVMHFRLMQMMTLVITPLEKDMPLMSVDYIYIAGKRKVYIEFYELSHRIGGTAEYERLKKVISMYNSLDDIKMGDTWYSNLLVATAYKTVSSRRDDEIEKLLVDTLEEYLSICDAEEKLDDRGQQKKIEDTRKYCNDLIDKGGVSTDVFRKQLGEDKTREFFDKVFFGTACSKVK